MLYQYSCWKFPYVAFSLLVSFCERFEIVWRSRVSITQGVIELKKKKKKHCAFQQCAHVNDFCWLHWEFCYMIWLLHAGTLGKPNLWNTYWEQHKQFHNEALEIKILLKVTKDRRNQWLPLDCSWSMKLINSLLIIHFPEQITAYNWAGSLTMSVSTTHKSNSCWIHDDVHEDASVPKRKKPHWFIKNY